MARSMDFDRASTGQSPAVMKGRADSGDAAMKSIRLDLERGFFSEAWLPGHCLMTFFSFIVSVHSLCSKVGYLNGYKSEHKIFLIVLCIFINFSFLLKYANILAIFPQVATYCFH